MVFADPAKVMPDFATLLPSAWYRSAVTPLVMAVDLS